MAHSWDPIDTFYDRFAEDCTLDGQAVRAIVSRVGAAEPVVPAGLRVQYAVQARVRVGEVPTRPACRTKLVDAAGVTYRVMGADYGSTRAEWLLTCTQEVTP
jgi:hypothetical protein